MHNWSSDMFLIPRDGNPIIVASKCGKVFKSRFMPDVGRFEGFNKGEMPVAWQPWPEHPNAR